MTQIMSVERITGIENTELDKPPLEAKKKDERVHKSPLLDKLESSWDFGGITSIKDGVGQGEDKRR